MELKYSQVTHASQTYSRSGELGVDDVQRHIDRHLAAGWKLRHYSSASEVSTEWARAGMIGTNNNAYAVTSSLVHMFIWERESRSAGA